MGKNENPKNSSANGPVPAPDNPRSIAIRALWYEFEPWLMARQQASQADLTRFLDQTPILPERVDEVRNLFRQEHLKFLRKAWMERLNRRGLSMYDWEMTDAEKQMMRKALEWTPGDMFEADKGYMKDGGAVNERKGKDAGGKQNQQLPKKQKNQQKNQQQSQKNQKQNQQKERSDHEEENILGDFFDEQDGKEAEKENALEQELESDAKKVNRRQKQNQNKQSLHQKKQYRRADDTSHIPPPQTYTIPLNYAAPQLSDPDYELLTELGMADFAVGVVESKIREFYTEACEATLLFNRNISVLSRGPALQNVQDHFNNRMKGLAMQKRKEWKELIDAELVRKVVLFDSGKKTKSKWRPEQIDRISSDLLRRGAIKQAARARNHGSSAGFSSVIPKQEAEPHRVKNFIEKVVKQVKFSSADTDEELADMPPLVYARSPGF